MITSHERLMAFNIQGGRCAVCGKQMLYERSQCAHRIARTKTNIRKWGDWVISSPVNIRMVCSLKCNDACNCGFRPSACLDILQKAIDEKCRENGIVPKKCSDTEAPSLWELQPLCNKVQNILDGKGGSRGDLAVTMGKLRKCADMNSEKYDMEVLKK